MAKSVFRVSYTENGQAKSAFVCAETGGDAAAFMGVTDGSAQVNAMASPVEVVGMDAAHAAVVPAPIFKAPPAPERQFTDAEMVELRKLLAKK